MHKKNLPVKNARNKRGLYMVERAILRKVEAFVKRIEKAKD